MRLPRFLREQLREALVCAFPTRPELEALVRTGLGKHLTTLVNAGDLRSAVGQLLLWVEMNGQWAALLTAAWQAHPRNVRLWWVATWLRCWVLGGPGAWLRLVVLLVVLLVVILLLAVLIGVILLLLVNVFLSLPAPPSPATATATATMMSARTPTPEPPPTLTPIAPPRVVVSIGNQAQEVLGGGAISLEAPPGCCTTIEITEVRDGQGQTVPLDRITYGWTFLPADADNARMVGPETRLLFYNVPAGRPERTIIIGLDAAGKQIGQFFINITVRPVR